MKITSKFIQQKLGFSRQRLYYWRNVGIFPFPPKNLGDSGQFCYSFHDLIVLKTIKLLKEAGVTTFHIRIIFERIKILFPEVKNPLAENQLVVFGGKIVYIKKGYAYDILTGQALLLDFKKVEKWVGEILQLQKLSQSAEKTNDSFWNTQLKIG